MKENKDNKSRTKKKKKMMMIMMIIIKENERGWVGYDDKIGRYEINK